MVNSKDPCIRITRESKIFLDRIKPHPRATYDEVICILKKLIERGGGG